MDGDDDHEIPLDAWANQLAAVNDQQGQVDGAAGAGDDETGSDPPANINGIDDRIESANMLVYAILGNSQMLGAAIAKLEPFSLQCTVDFSPEKTVTFRIRDRNKIFALAIDVTGWLVYRLHPSVARTGLTITFSTKALKRCAASCKVANMLTLAVPLAKDTMTWRLRPSEGLGMDERFTLHAYALVAEDDVPEDPTLDPAITPPTVQVRMTADSFGRLIDSAYKNRGASLYATFHVSIAGTSLTARTWSASFPKTGPFTDDLPAKDTCHVNEDAESAKAAFSLVYMQLLAAFRTGMTAVDITFPRRAAVPGERRTRNAWTAQEMPMHLRFWGKTRAGANTQVRMVLGQHDVE